LVVNGACSPATPWWISPPAALVCLTVPPPDAVTERAAALFFLGMGRLRSMEERRVVSTLDLPEGNAHARARSAASLASTPLS
jgi:hypothetical protein